MLLAAMVLLTTGLARADAQEAPDADEADSHDAVVVGGGEPPSVPDPTLSSGDGDGDGRGNAFAAADSNTRTLSRTKKIPAAAFQNPTGNGVVFTNDGSCVHPINGSDELFAPVMGLPAGATIIEMFAEGIDNDTVPWRLTFESGDGDGGSPLHADVSSTGAGFVNVSDTTITSSLVTDIGGSGTSYWLEWDPNNTEAGGADDGDHQICQVWIRYNITETYLTDVFSFVPVTPCAEFDTRPGTEGYTASFSRMTVGDTYAIKLEGVNAQVTCGTPADADGFLVSVFLINPSALAWLNVYSSGLPNNEEAVIVGGPDDPLESVSLLVEDAFIGGSDVKLTVGGTPGATVDVKFVITGYYELSDQPVNRYAD